MELFLPLIFEEFKKKCKKIKIKKKDRKKVDSNNLLIFFKLY